MTYAGNGNITAIGGVGSFSYGDASHPYRVTGYTPASGSSAVQFRDQTVTYSATDRPLVLSEGGRSAAFTYNAAGDRAMMEISDSSGEVLTRYYAGGRYELDHTSSSTTERLYLGGDAYSAPLVYQKTGSGSWTLYNIGRDYQGSITHIATAGGTLVAEYSYDPWGRMRSPADQTLYAAGSEPDLLLGRGYTGHEHLLWFGLVNMNARLYDPALGRFLSPDPYVQAPDFTQNFNRYSYALNNPLKYTDISGELFGIDDAIIAIIVGATVGALSGAIAGVTAGAQGFGQWFGYIFAGCVVGALSAGVGISVGGAIASATGFGGFVGGALSGMAGGSAGGFVSGFYGTALAGGEFSDGFVNGLKSAGMSALLGGFLGGLAGGIQSAKNGGDFWSGRNAIDEFSYRLLLGDTSVEVGDGMEYSNEYAKSFSDRNFGEQRFVKNLFADGRFPKGRGYEMVGDYVVNKSGETVLGVSLHHGIGKGSDVFLYKAAFTSKEQLYLTMGHEYLHVSFYHLGLSSEFSRMDSHAAIYEWAFRQSLAWGNYSVDLLHYSNMYNAYSMWLPFNPYSYQGAGFNIIYHLPL